MKRFVFLFPVIAFALLSVSCQKELIEGSNVERGDAQFTAILEKVDAGTKTTVEKKWGDLGYQIYETKWESTDTINVNGIKCTATPDSGDPTKAGFTMLPGSTMPSSPFNAYFPASMYDGTTATLPASYDYKKGKYNMPMYAKSDETTLSFKNLCGVLAITLDRSKSFNYVYSIEVISSNRRMNGAFNIDASGDLSFTSSDALTDADKKVKIEMDLANGAVDFSGSTYYVPVPAGHHDTLTIVVTENLTTTSGEPGTLSMQTKKVDGVDVARNTVYEVSFVDNVVLPLTPDTSEPPYCMEFVNIGGKKWAKYNIGATTEAGTYKTCFGDYYQWGSLYRLYSEIYFGVEQRPDWEDMKKYYSEQQIQYFLNTPSITFKLKPERKWGFDPRYVNFQDHNVYEPEDIVQRIMKNETAEEGIYRMPTTEDFNDLIMDCWDGEVPSSGNFKMPPLNSDDPGKGIYYLSAEQTYLSAYQGVAGVLFVNGEKHKLFFPLTGHTNTDTSGNTEIRNIGESGWYLTKCYEKIDDRYYRMSYLTLSDPDPNASGDWDPTVGYLTLKTMTHQNFYDPYFKTYYCEYRGFSIRAVNDVLSDPAVTAPDYDGSAVGVTKMAGFWWAPYNCSATDTGPYMYFQWGRKYGQNASLGTITPETMTQADDTEANKNIFGSSSGGNWFSGVNNGLWRSGKGIGDPCPTGWRVPTKAELEALAAHFSGWTTNGSLKGRYFSGDQTYSDSGPRIFLPAAGYRDREGAVQGKNTDGYYWSSSFNGDNAWCLKFSEDEEPVFVTDYEGNRVNGYTVRCIHQY